MFNIAVVPNDTSANLSLSFRNKELATKAYEFFCEGMDKENRLLCDDEFGHRLSIHGKSISYVIFVDIEAEQSIEYEKNTAIARGRDKLVETLEKSGVKLTKQPINGRNPKIIM